MVFYCQHSTKESGIFILHSKRWAVGAAAAIGLALSTGIDAEASTWTPRSTEAIAQDVQQAQDADGNLRYTVKPGDTLGRIAQATDTAVNRLVQINELESADIIHVGNVLHFSADRDHVTVDRGEAVQAYDISEDVVSEDDPDTLSSEKTQEDSSEAREEQANPADTEEAEAAKELQTNSPSAPIENPSATADNTSPSPSLGSFDSTAYAVGDNLTPGTVTANGTDVSNTIYSGGHRIIATDPAVIPTGTVVRLEYPDGTSFTAVAADTGSAINGHKIDLLVDSPSEALQYGYQTGIQIHPID